MMKTLILVLFISVGAIAEEPLFNPADIAQWTYTTDDGTVVHDAVLLEKTIRGRKWYVSYFAGIVVTMSPNDHGDIEFTWDSIIYADKDQELTTFPVFYKHPQLGLSWNPDGVEIRVEKVNHAYTINDLVHTADEYGFYKNDIEVARAWISHTDGILKVQRTVHGKQFNLTRLFDRAPSK